MFLDLISTASTCFNTVGGSTPKFGLGSTNKHREEEIKYQTKEKCSALLSHSWLKTAAWVKNRKLTAPLHSEVSYFQWLALHLTAFPSGRKGSIPPSCCSLSLPWQAQLTQHCFWKRPLPSGVYKMQAINYFLWKCEITGYLIGICHEKLMIILTARIKSTSCIPRSQ